MTMQKSAIVPELAVYNHFFAIPTNCNITATRSKITIGFVWFQEGFLRVLLRVIFHNSSSLATRSSCLLWWTHFQSRGGEGFLSLFTTSFHIRP